MNLIVRPRPAIDPIGQIQPRRGFTDAAIVATLTAQKATLQSELDAATVSLQAALVQMFRDELETLRGGQDSAAPIAGIVQRITTLEGEINAYTQALAALPEPEEEE